MFVIPRPRFLPVLLVLCLGALFAARLAHSADTGSIPDTSLFGEPTHKLVYQLNQADHDYMEHILFSAGEMLRKYGDDIHLVVTVIGPGIHLLGKNPERPIPKLLQQRAESLAMYGVEFHACGNTMKTLGWTGEDLLDFATVISVGADDLMRLQEKGYSYISW
jgi:hypothetical protein